MASGVALLLLLLIATVKGFPISLDDVEHVGCYNDEFAKNSFYKIHMPLSVIQSVNFCNHRLLKYVGIQTNLSSFNPAYVSPYCGDDIPERSTKSNSCHPCVDNSTMFCGGENSISVYKISELASFIVLLATQTGIKMIADNSNTPFSIEGITNDVISVDFNYKLNSIIFSTYRTISRLIMFLRNGHLSFLELGTNSLRNLNLSLPYIYKVHRISINTRHKALYAIGEADALLYYLFSMNYDGSNMKKLYEGPELINPSGLGVVDNKVVWAAYNDTNDMNVLYMCYLSPICQANNITIIYESNEVIRDVKLYSPEVQMPDKEMLCLQLFCSHSCKMTTPFIATCTCPDDLVLGPDNTTCLEKPKPKKDPQDIGCYTISYSESRLYKVHHPLSWEECINLCNRRSSVYAGIQAEQGYPTYNFVFCGNDIKQHSTTANSSLCLPCMDDKTRLCGGQNTLSLYQLRESNPLVLYLATESGLKIFSTESLSTEALTGSSSPTTAVGFSYWEDDIFSLSHLGISRLYYSPFSDMYIESTLVFECDSSMAIDWINKYIYCRRRGNSYFYEIDWTRQKPPRQLMSFYNNLQDMEVDPFARQLFFVENGQLSRLSIYENSRIKYDYEKLHLKKVLKIALDVELKFVYLIGIENDENHCLIKTDYEFKQMRVLYSGDHVTDPISVDVLKRDVIWGVKSDDGFFVYRCELTPRCLKDNIQRLYRSSEAIHDIKIYHPDKQPHNAMYLCSRLQCSHNCSVTQDQVSCTCPDGMSLSSDNVTCQDITSTTNPTSVEQSETSKVTASFPHFLMSTPSAAVVHQELPQEYTKATPPSNVDTSNETSDRLPVIVTCVVGILAVVGLLLFVVWRTKHELIPNLGNSYAQNSQLELTHSNVAAFDNVSN
ncbi:uncharacterized protein LOC124353572 [Homalodisca vitripennis]|uniref:uncharacterized protein LOC124353572 n=1 Tax=Homalodisca vitripennis TaxID=197043 RepID=UPI001EE9C332|nr:uncharacterized protein LOC124353572 [Homalodisca vitripennis]